LICQITLYGRRVRANRRRPSQTDGALAGSPNRMRRTVIGGGGERLWYGSRQAQSRTSIRLMAHSGTVNEPDLRPVRWPWMHRSRQQRTGRRTMCGQDWLNTVHPGRRAGRKTGISCRFRVSTKRHGYPQFFHILPRFALYGPRHPLDRSNRGKIGRRHKAC
jgi:hypothetical protein